MRFICRQLFIHLFFCLLSHEHLDTFTGGYIYGHEVWGRSQSPYLIERNVVINSEASLTIQQGVLAKFQSGVGIIVRGRLQIEGTLTNPVVMTSWSEITDTISHIDSNDKLRLIDGIDQYSGKLQIYYKNNWRTVCSPGIRWTKSDLDVVCHQLGLNTSLDFITDSADYLDTKQEFDRNEMRLVYATPSCRGNEQQIQMCAWKNAFVDNNLYCGEENDEVRVRCSSTSNTRTAHWAGISFDHAAHRSAVNKQVSMSSLQNLFLSNAGITSQSQFVSAIRSSGVAPNLIHVTVRNSAADAVKYSSIPFSVSITNCSFTNNNGHGIYVDTYEEAKLDVTNTLSQNNGRDGLRFLRRQYYEQPHSDYIKFSHNYSVNQPKKTYNFCSYLPNLYPIRFRIVSSVNTLPIDCKQSFNVKDGYKLQVEFLRMNISKSYHESSLFSRVSVYDGLNGFNHALLDFKIRNTSQPFSILSISREITIHVQARNFHSMNIFFLISALPDNSGQLTIRDSRLIDNKMYGVALGHISTSVSIHSTSFQHNRIDAILAQKLSGPLVLRDSHISHSGRHALNIQAVCSASVFVANTSLTRNMGSALHHVFGLLATRGQQRSPPRDECCEMYRGFAQLTVISSNISDNQQYGLLSTGFFGSSGYFLIKIRNNKFERNSLSAFRCKFSHMDQIRLFLTHNLFIEASLRRSAVHIQHTERLVGYLSGNEFCENRKGALYVLAHAYTNDVYCWPLGPQMLSYQHSLLQKLFRFDLRHRKRWSYDEDSMDEFDELDEIGGLAVFYNRIYNNSGRHPVHLHTPCRAADYMSVTPIYFQHNTVERNRVEEGVYMKRRRAAPVVVHSPLAFVYRNRFSNPASSFELSVWLLRPDLVVNISHNWFGSQYDHDIYARIFDRKDCWQLSKADFCPFLLNHHDTRTSLLSYECTNAFVNSRIDELGGEVDGRREVLNFRTLSTNLASNATPYYTVTRDILVKPGAVLVIPFGVKLAFQPGVGMLVLGQLQAEGASLTVEDRGTIFSLLEHNVSRYVSPLLRLINGRTRTEGILQVSVNGTFGSVCNHNWNYINSYIVCTQLALSFDAGDWQLSREDLLYPDASPGLVILSDVKCSEFDHDLLEDCDYNVEEAKHIERTCNDVVMIRCHPLGWAGIRVGPSTATSSYLKNVIISGVGFTDSTDHRLFPALRYDWFSHSVSHLVLRDNAGDAIELVLSPLIGEDHYRVTRLLVERSGGNALTVHDANVHVTDCKFANNNGSALHFDAISINRVDVFYITFLLSMLSTNVYIIDDKSSTFTLDSHDPVSFLFLAGSLLNVLNSSIQLNIGTENHVTIQTVFTRDFISTKAIKVLIYQLEYPEKIWILPDDLESFPLFWSPGRIMIHFSSSFFNFSNNFPILFIFTPRRYSVRSMHLLGLQISRVEMFDNSQAVSGVVYSRGTNKTIEMNQCIVRNNRLRSVSVRIYSTFNLGERLPFFHFSLQNSFIQYGNNDILLISDKIEHVGRVINWTMSNVTVDNSSASTISFHLPFINTNVHAVDISNCVWRSCGRLQNIFHGYPASIRYSQNSWIESVIPADFITITGSEKQLHFVDNTHTQNTLYGSFFHSDVSTHSLWTPSLDAAIMRNNISGNRVVSDRSVGSNVRSDEHCLFEVTGLQLARISQNTLSYNGFNCLLLAATKSILLHSRLAFDRNFLLGTDAGKTRVLDFDFWNSYIPVDHEFSNGTEHAVFSNNVSNKRKLNFYPSNSDDDRYRNIIGGRIMENLVLRASSQVYHVTTDITVMPNTVLTIEPGVRVKFAPNVGVLVLGQLIARGLPDRRIILEPLVAFSTPDTMRRFHYSARINSTHRWRLCRADVCGESVRDGVLQQYDSAVRVWHYVCHPQWTNATRLCNTLARAAFTDHVQFEFISRAEGALPADVACYMHVDCTVFFTMSSGWGGLRFGRLGHSTGVHSSGTRPDASLRNVLEHVDIVGVSRLHNSLAPALLLDSCHVARLSHVSVVDSLSHAIIVLNPLHSLSMDHLTLRNNRGYGVVIETLRGVLSNFQAKSFLPFIQYLPLSFESIGMAAICTTEKYMEIDDRFLLYYSTSQHLGSKECVKVFHSKHQRIGFRLLHVNYMNSNSSTAILQVWDGQITMNHSSRLLYTYNSSNSHQNMFWQSSNSNLSVVLATEPFTESSNFIIQFVAEIVVLPISFAIDDHDLVINLTHSEIEYNRQGAIFSMNTGEVTPSLEMHWNRLLRNGYDLSVYLPAIQHPSAINHSLDHHTVHILSHNSRSFIFKNNLMRLNYGGLLVKSTAFAVATVLRSHIERNVFIDQQFGSVIQLISSNNSLAHQKANFRYNSISNCQSFQQPIILIDSVDLNFIINSVENNVGFFILFLTGFYNFHIKNSLYIIRNIFVGNNATNELLKSTVATQNANQQYKENFFLNSKNNYELAVLYRNISNTSLVHALDAANNWWGYNNSVAIQSRIWDSSDDTRIKIDIDENKFLQSNSSLLDANCAAGWSLVHNVCFRFFPVPVYFYEAQEICKEFQSTLPYHTDNYERMIKFISRVWTDYNWRTNAIWAKHSPHARECSQFLHGEMQTVSCTENLKLPFICEQAYSWTLSDLTLFSDTRTSSMTLVTVASVLMCIVVCLALLMLWCLKSKQRRREKWQRRNSIRLSVHSLRSLTSSYSDVAGTVYPSHRTNFNPMPGQRDLAADNSVSTLSQPYADDFHSITDSLTADDTHMMLPGTSQLACASSTVPRACWGAGTPSSNRSVLSSFCDTMGYENPVYRDKSSDYSSAAHHPAISPTRQVTGYYTSDRMHNSPVTHHMFQQPVTPSYNQSTMYDDSSSTQYSPEPATTYSTLDLKRRMEEHSQRESKLYTDSRSIEALNDSSSRSHLPPTSLSLSRCKSQPLETAM